jgi:hypothetical protein
MLAIGLNVDQMPRDLSDISPASDAPVLSLNDLTIAPQRQTLDIL